MSITNVIALQNELKQVERLVELKKRGGVHFWEPHRKQDLFHRAGSYKFRYLRTGNRFGKSDVGAAEDVAWLMGERVWYPENDPARFDGIPRRSVKGLLIVVNWEKCEEIFTNQTEGDGKGKLFKMIPKNSLVDFSRNQQGKINRITVKSRWGGCSELFITTVKTFKNDELSQESSDWDFIHVDEPIPKKMWEAVSRGLMDRNGKGWFCCTPLNEPWINDFFLPSRRTKVDPDQPFINNYKWMITGSGRDNPHNSVEGMNTFLENLDANTRACRESGIPLAMAGCIYHEFDHDAHVVRKVPHGWSNTFEPPLNYTIRFAIDPHPQTPHAVLFAATAPTGEVYFFWELFKQVSIKDLAESIKSVIGKRHVETMLCDPLAFINNPVDNTTMADVLWSEGLWVEKAPKDLTRGILQVKQALRERIHTAVGEHPRLLFMEHLEETLHEFDVYEWDLSKVNKPRDVDDHMMENLYRLVITGLHYVAPPGMDDVRSFDVRSLSPIDRWTDNSKLGV